MENAGAINDIERLLHPELLQVGAKEIHFRVLALCQLPRLLQTALRQIEGGDLKSVFGEENGVPPFSAAHFQKAHGPVG